MRPRRIVYRSLQPRSVVYVGNKGVLFLGKSSWPFYDVTSFPIIGSSMIAPLCVPFCGANLLYMGCCSALAKPFYRALLLAAGLTLISRARRPNSPMTHPWCQTGSTFEDPLLLSTRTSSGWPQM